MKKSIRSSNSAVNIEGQDKFLTRILRRNTIPRIIPDSSIDEAVDSAPLIKVTESDTFIFKDTYPIYYYSGKKIDDIIFIAQYALNRKREEKGKYSIHSSAVEKNGNAIILFGWKDTGKTTTAIKLTEEYDFKFVSEGSTVIDENLKICGRILLLEGDKGYLKTKYNFKNKYKAMNELCCVSDNSAKIKMMIYVQLSPFKEVKLWGNTNQSKFHMYELFSQDIRGVTKIINNYKMPLKSLDTKKIAFCRAKFINKLVSNVPIYQIRGDPEFVSKIINNITDNKFIDKK